LNSSSRNFGDGDND
jgi:hypothetical protein